MSDQLKPCPFCGGHATVVDYQGSAIHVRCKCGAQVWGGKKHFGSIQNAADAWNTRALLAQPNTCTCPSGDGSLRWPCPVHQAEATAAASFSDGIEAAAKLIERRMNEYVNEHGSYDHDTGYTEFPGNGEETVEEWLNLAEGIRAIKPDAKEPVCPPEPVGMFAYCEDKKKWLQQKPKGPEFSHLFTPLYRHPPAQAPVACMADAYVGAREELAVWKKTTLEAEAKIRAYDQRIVDLGVLGMQTAVRKPAMVPVVFPERKPIEPLDFNRVTEVCETKAGTPASTSSSASTRASLKPRRSENLEPARKIFSPALSPQISFTFKPAAVAVWRGIAR